MSSLLQRLAGAALGAPTPTLHAMARLPYLAPPALMPADTDADAPAALQPATPPQAGDAPLPTVAPWANSKPPSSRPTAPPATVESRPPAPPPASRQPVDTHGARPPRATAEPADIPPDAPPAERFSITIGPPPGPGTRSATPTPPPVVENTNTASPVTRPQQLTPSARQAGPHLETRLARPPSPPFDPAAAPRALLPQTPGSPPPRPAGPAALRPPIHSQPTVAAEPDIHVHIGRVEVTAVHRPAEPPRRSPPSRPQPMSLDEYLARREGRQP